MNIADFKDRHAGERCAILANGETVADFPRDWKEIVIGLNRSWEITDAAYHCIIDKKQLMAAADCGVKFRHLFVGQGDDAIVEARKLAVLDRVDAESVTLMPGQSKRRIVVDGRVHKLGFCLDLVNDRFYIPSVPYMALQIAAWIGFKEMHFWGLDLHGSKFWNEDWKMSKDTAQLQDRQFKLANRKLKALGVRVVNHSQGTHCTAFERA